MTYSEVELGFSKCASRISVRIGSGNFFHELQVVPEWTEPTAWSGKIMAVGKC